MILIGLSLWFAMLFRAQCEEMWYHNEATRLWKLFKNFPALARWYKGHVSLIQALWPDCPRWMRYNPAWPLPMSPFFDDAWHVIKKLEFASWGAAFGVMTDSVLWGIAVYLLLGIFFYINFHALIPAQYEGSWRSWHWILNFWKPR